jgi:hypothetical protein
MHMTCITTGDRDFLVDSGNVVYATSRAGSRAW